RFSRDWSSDVCSSDLKRKKVSTVLYTHEDDFIRRRQLRLAQDLPEAIAQDQLLLNYQPIVRISDQRVIGVEALVRWKHPKQGLQIGRASGRDRGSGPA